MAICKYWRICPVGLSKCNDCTRYAEESYIGEADDLWYDERIDEEFIHKTEDTEEYNQFMRLYKKLNIKAMNYFINNIKTDEGMKFDHVNYQDNKVQIYWKTEPYQSISSKSININEFLKS